MKQVISILISVTALKVNGIYTLVKSNRSWDVLHIFWVDTIDSTLQDYLTPHSGS